MEVSKKVRNKALIASLIGSAIEYYDYLLYGTVAALVLNDLFFPTFSPLVGTLIALASFGIPYFFRPLGGIVFSHIGDKLGRKKSLVLTLGLMGGATMFIGLLPTYDTIGVWAPILLIVLRLIQGFAVGGEWGGAVLLAVEYSEEKNKGFSGSVPMMGSAVGLLLGTASVSIMSLLPNDQFLAWGWRVPFVCSIFLVFIGLWIRSGLAETPDFQKAKDEGNISKLPIADTLRYHWKEVLLTAGAKAVETAPFYIFSTFVISYATTNLNMDKVPILNAITIGTLVATILIPIFGTISDRIGRKAMFMAGTGAMLVFAFPYFFFIQTKSVLFITIATVIGFALWAMITSVLGTLFSETFSANIRYTGISVGYQLGAALFGGTAPLVAVALVAEFNSWVPVAIYIMCISLLAIICMAIVRTSHRITNQPTSVPTSNEEII